MISERAPAKLNLVLHVGAPRPDGMHPLCSLIASLELADQVTVEDAPRDEVVCPGVDGRNLAADAVASLREATAGALPPLRVRIDKQIPVAAGLAGGSADAAAVLRAGNELLGGPLPRERLAELGAGLGSDVPSQIDPRHALVAGVGERVEPLALPAAAVVLVPAAEGLSTADVYRELDRIGRFRDRLETAPLRELAGSSLPDLSRGLENDLAAAALSLRPELSGTLEALRASGALGTGISGSGPTAFGLFVGSPEAERAAAALHGALVTRLRDVRAPGARAA